MKALAALLVIVLHGSASAQPRRGPDPQERREAIKQRIRALRAVTLTDELKLDDKALARVLPALSKWDDVIDDLVRKRADIQQRLVAADGRDPKATDRIIDEALANQRAIWDSEDKRLADLRKLLTPGQMARLIIVLPAFERRLQNQLQRAANRRPGQPLDEDDEPPPMRRR